MLKNAIDLLQHLAHSMHRILRVAQTIADLVGSAKILGPHVAKAIGVVSAARPRSRRSLTQAWREATTSEPRQRLPRA